jgi:sec-independent protein translocase protein TatC
MPALRPVSTEARLTLVEHLSELRTRLIVSIAIFAVAFAFTYWQNKNVLEIVNQPLESAVAVKKDCNRAGDPLEAGACFDRAVAKALSAVAPVLETAAAQNENPAAALQAKKAAESLDRAQKLAPTSTSRRPVTLGVAEPFFQTLNVAMYAALVITLPLILYQLYAFLIPAFTRREKQAIVPLLIGVPFLFYGGVAFGYFLALPRAVDFLQNFNDDSFDILVQAKDYYKFVALFLAGTGIVFQVPVVVLGISRMGLLSARQMRKQRGYVALGAAVIAAIVTPTPDAVTMLLMMVPLLVLFEASVFIASLLERRRATAGPSRWDDDEDDEVPPPPAGGGDHGTDDGSGGPDDGPAGGGPGPEPDGPPDYGVGYGGEGDDAPWESPWDEDDDVVPVDTAFGPPGEQPDPELLGDPAGPRVLGSEPDAGRTPAPDRSGPEAEWEVEADAFDAADPYAGSPIGGTAEAEPGQEDEWQRDADALDATDPYAENPPSGRDIDGSNRGT